MSADQILGLLKNPNKSDNEVMSIITFMGLPCQQSLRCPKLVAIRDHIEDYCIEQSLHSVDNEIVKNTYEEEYWKHAPDNLKELKKKLLEDPLNYHIMDKFSLLKKNYDYQIKYPWYRLLDGPAMRKKEKKRIVKFMSQPNNYDTE